MNVGDQFGLSDSDVEVYDMTGVNALSLPDISGSLTDFRTQQQEGQRQEGRCQKRQPQVSWEINTRRTVRDRKDVQD